MYQQRLVNIRPRRQLANLDISNTNRIIALAQYDKAIQSAFREAADALAEHGTLDERLVAQASLENVAEKSYHIDKVRYRKRTETYVNARAPPR